MEKTILITGGLGFIGMNLTRYLLKNYKYKIIILAKTDNLLKRTSLLANLPNRNLLKIAAGDILEKKFVEKLVKDSSIIIHLAAETYTLNPLSKIEQMVLTNVIGTTKLLELAVTHRIEKIILFSSCAVYGNKIKGISMDENHSLVPITPYAATKLAADRIAYSFFKYYKLPVTIIRPFNIYGPYQSPKYMIPLFITRLLRDLPIYLNHKGKQTRDWLYIDDFIDAIEKIIIGPLKKLEGQVFNIASGKVLSVAKISHLILRKLKKGHELIRLSATANPEPFESAGIAKKIKRVLGWKPRVSFYRGLDKTIDWYIKNREFWNNS